MGRKKPPDAEFERTVQELLSEGLHVKRGISAEEYVRVCKKVWNECITSPEFPTKVLVDPLHPVNIANSNQDYIHRQVFEAINSQIRESADIYCHAVGLRNLDMSVETGEDDSSAEGDPPASEESDVPEIRRYVVGVFDVLGFSDLVRQTALRDVIRLYDKLITDAVTTEAMRTFSVARLNRTEAAGMLFSLPVGHAHFSDTILLWVPLVQHFIAPFIARCADLVCDALKLGIPLRGGIAAGEAVFHVRSGTFIGQPIVEAARLEASQNWLGVSLGLSMLASDISREFDPSLVLPYEAPTKRQKRSILSGLALDWPRRFDERHGSDPFEALRLVDTSPSHRIYYENARKFVRFSAGPILRRDGMQPGNLRALASAAVEVRAGASSFREEDQRLLRDIEEVGPNGTSVAEFIRAIAKGDAAPDLAPELPANLKRYLHDLSDAATGSAKYFKLNDIVVQALSVRLKGGELSRDALERLDELATFGGTGLAAARFIRALAAGRSTDLPKGLSREFRSFFRQAIDWANGKVPRGPLQILVNACLENRFGYGELSAYDWALLELLEASSEPWPSVAGFLRDVSVPNRVPQIPVGLPKRLEQDLTRTRYAADLAMVQPPRILEVVSVGLGDPNTGADLFTLVRTLAALKGTRTRRIPRKLESLIAAFEDAAPERAVVARCLRSLATGSWSTTADDLSSLPIALKQFALQIRAVSVGAPLPLDAQILGWAAIRSRHGKGDLGDCIQFSFRVMLNAGGEFARLAEYFVAIAQGSPAGPAPEFSSPRFCEIAQEVRILADPNVSGTRLAMIPAGSKPAGYGGASRGNARHIAGEIT